MKTKARLTLRCSDADNARSLGEVLAPDNVRVPRGQRLSMHRSSASLEFEADSDQAKSLASTLLSVLSDASLFQEVWLLSRARDAAVGRRPRA